MHRSAKHRTSRQVITFEGGMDVSRDSMGIPDNAQTLSYNMMYTPLSGEVRSRGGITCKTSAAPATGKSISRLIHYVKDSSNDWLVCACDKKVWYKTTAAATWTRLGTFTCTSDPDFLQFNNLLLIATGAGIKSWNGATVSDISGAPEASILMEAGTRVWVNHVSEPDYVYASGAEDEDDWDTVSGAAVAIPAGFGDGMTVNAIDVAPGGNDILVSKTGRQKAIYRINISGTTDTWTANYISRASAAESRGAMAPTANGVWFYDAVGGFKAVAGVQEYGDLQPGVIARAINPYFSGRSITCYQMDFVRTLGAVLFCGGESGGPEIIVLTPDGRATVWYLSGKTITSFVETDDGTLYMGSSDGFLYEYTNSTPQDTLTYGGTGSDFVSFFRTKMFDFGGGAILRQAQLSFRNISSGSASFMVIGSDEETRETLGEFTLYNMDVTGELYSATGELNLADVDLDAKVRTTRIFRNRYRDTAMQFQIRATSGQYAMSRLSLELARVEG